VVQKKRVAIAIFTEKQLIFPYTSKTVFRLIFTAIWICFYGVIGKKVPRKRGDRHQIVTKSPPNCTVSSWQLNHCSKCLELGLAE
jgi:hypothetical protein